ncbi:MAG: tripartite tricarboxylate transporter permease [Thermodesulfovibrionales bacterium]
MLDGVTGIIDNLGNLFTFYHMAILLVGVMGGLILGALPGVSPTLSVALLVPFTFYMEPASGLILLGAVYMAAVAGGAISAILINVPGAPANIATLLDGYPLARAGKAESTLYTSFISSFIGGVFGMLVMIFLTFPLAEFALKFRSVEIFWIAVLGLTVVAGLGSGSLLKSLIAGAFGVWMSTVGPNPTTGEFRFIFHDVLTGGIDIIPALIGLFAIPQVFQLVETQGMAREAIHFRHEKGVFREAFFRTVRMFRVQSIGSVVGAIIGLIPGVGGQVAGIVAYDQVKKYSRHPEKFGTGIPDGVAAAESANNAMVGPSLVPLLTLSIPGSPTAAVLLGGLLIHGIFPGPDLFRLHGDIAHTFIGSLLLAQFVMLVFGVILSRYSNWVMRVPDIYMAASIVVLAVFGTYTVSNNFNDVIVMFAIGLVTYVGIRYGFSAAPAVMGLILGRIAENAFLKGMLIAQASDGVKYFFSGWINIVVIGLCVASLVFGILGTKKGAGKKAAAKSDVWAAALLVAFSAGVYLFGLDVRDPLSALFPAATLVLVGALSVLLLARSALSIGKAKGDGPARAPRVNYGKVGLALSIVLVYFYLLRVLGFYFTSFAFYVSFVTVFTARKRPALVKVHYRALIAAAFVAALYVLFRVVLNATTPRGLVL